MASKPLFIRACSLLRQVCLNSRAVARNLKSCFLETPFAVFLVDKSGWSKAAAFAVLTGVSGGGVAAQNLEPVSASTGWQPRAGFVENVSAPVTNRARPLSGSRRLDQLLSLIALAEANNGYDSVIQAARVKPPARPTQMTIAQIYEWIEETPGQHHAIGRYQFIPSTLRELVRLLDVPASSKFDPRLQDRLATALIAQAGYDQFRTEQITSSRFMDNLALIWAGLPKANGRSAYHGYAGNRATITRTKYEQLFLGIFG